MVLSHGIPPDFSKMSLHLYHQRPWGQSRVCRVMPLCNNSVHCRESACTGPVVFKAVLVMDTLFITSLQDTLAPSLWRGCINTQVFLSNPNIPRDWRNAVPEGNDLVQQQEEFESDQPTPESSSSSFSEQATLAQFRHQASFMYRMKAW